jgi:transcriptional regulator with XRE-family HTH domain
MTSNERFRALRKALGLNMQQMGDVLGISHSGISNIESGNRAVSEKHIRFLSLKYPQVNAEWLRSGKGDMFLDVEPVNQIDQLCDDYGMGAWVRRFLHEYARLSESEKTFIDGFIVRAVSGEYDDEVKRAGILSDATPAPDFDIDAEVESYRQELIREKRAAGASGRFRDTGAAKD